MERASITKRTLELSDLHGQYSIRMQPLSSFGWLKLDFGPY